MLIALILQIRHFWLIFFIANPKSEKRLRLTDIENKSVVTSGERKGGRGEIRGTNYYV